MNAKTKGTICGIIAAVSYGTNPLGALSLYDEGINVNSVLFYRYAIAAVILLAVLVVKKENFRLNKKEFKVVAALGILFATSSSSLFTSFHYMDAGIASTILFVYPIMVAIIMAVCFHERISIVTISSIVLAIFGIGLLYNGGEAALSSIGIGLVFISALTYAVYIVLVNRAALQVSTLKLTFYVLVFCVLTIVISALMGAKETGTIQLLTTSSSWFYAIMLALVPTIISLITMNIAVCIIGSTPTAIMGALEPLTAVIIGVTIFGEALTLNLTIGIFLILVSVILIIVGQSTNTRRIIDFIHRSRLKIRHRF